MTEMTAVEAATTRLERALRTLEEAVDCRLEQNRSRGEVADQLHGLEMDRARLASELDQSIARSRRLEQTNRAVAEQLDSAMEAIRAVIAAKVDP